MFTLGERLIFRYLIITVIIYGLHRLGGFFNGFHIENRFCFVSDFLLLG